MPDSPTVANGAQGTMAEAASLAPTAILELYEINATALGAGTFRLCVDVFGNGFGVIFAGNTYTPYDLAIKGFIMQNKGELPRPTAQFSNLFGAFTALNFYYQDLVGAKLTRFRVYARHLDAENWTNRGLPVPDGYSPNPNAGWPKDVYFFHQKTHQNKIIVEYELASILEIENVQLPGRQVFANLCASLYRSPECSYTGIPLADIDGNPAPINLRVNDNAVTAATFDITEVPLWSPTATYQKRDIVKITLDDGRDTLFVALANNLTGANAEPPNTAFWFADDCSRCWSSGCSKRYGKGPAPFAGFPGTQTTPVTAGATA